MKDTELQARYQATVAARTLTSRVDCPSPEELQALVERTGDEDKRLAVLDHAMSCEPCHRDLALLHAIHAAQPRRVTLMPRQWLLAASLLIVLAGGALLSRQFGRPVADDVTRGASDAAGVLIVAPVGPVSPGQLHTLVWRSVPGTVRYTVEVLDAEGRVLYTTRTTDTLVGVPQLSGVPAASWVRADLRDGTDRRSPIVSLGTR